MIGNLAARGVKRLQAPPKPDILTVREYHPEVLASLAVLSHKMGIVPHWLFKDYVSGFITSGYRDAPVDSQVTNSPHYFALALDIAVGNVMKQISWGNRALEFHLFYRIGLYPQNGFVHLDLCDINWMEIYHGMPFWVRYNGKYTSFHRFGEASTFALKCVTPGD